MGHSLGGGISIVKAAEDKRITSLITLASVGTFRNLWPKEYEQQWKMMGILYIPNHRTNQQMPVKASLLEDLERNPGRLNVLARASEVKQPWLLFHGTADTTVPVSQAHDLKAMQPNAELVILPNADHVFGGTHPYLSEQMPPALHDLCERALAFLNKVEA
jgi:dienelactone hydrolase